MNSICPNLFPSIIHLSPHHSERAPSGKFHKKLFAYWAINNMKWLEHSNILATCLIIQGDFFNWPSPENVSRLAPPKFAWTGPPPNFSKCWNHIHFARHLGVFRSEGGPVLDRSQPLFYFVPQDSHSQAGSTSQSPYSEPFQNRGGPV